MDQFHIDLKKLLEKTLTWSETFKKGDRNYHFDVDDEMYELSKKYSMDFNKGYLKLIYSLLDFYCDAIKHDFKQIDKNYTVLQACSDIKTVKSVLETNSAIELPKGLEERLKSI